MTVAFPDPALAFRKTGWGYFGAPCQLCALLPPWQVLPACMSHFTVLGVALHVLLLTLFATDAQTVVGINDNCHDKSIAIADNGTILATLELRFVISKKTRTKYTPSKKELKAFGQLWKDAYAAVSDAWSAPQPAEVGVVVGGIWMHEAYWQHHKLRSSLPVAEWRDADHHLAHATHGFFDSPFASALVITADGGGNDGLFNAYWASRAEDPPVRLLHNYGSTHQFATTYLFTASLVNGTDVTMPRCSDLCEARCMSGPGVLMGLALQGTPQQRWVADLKHIYNHTDNTPKLRELEKLEETVQTRQDQLDFAATSQKVPQPSTAIA